MSDRLLRHLVVGLGSIGKRHVEILGRYPCEIAGVDPDTKIEDPGFPVYSSLEDGLAFMPDMVWLCSPTQCHADQAMAVMEKNIALFIEKPMAHTMEQAKKMMACYERLEKKNLVWVGCNMRFHPAVIKLKQFLEKESIGRPLVFKIHFSHWLPGMRPQIDYRTTYAASKEGGGILLDDIHDIDLALHFAGPVKKAVGLSWKSGCLEMDAEDIAGIHMVHENNIFTQIQMDFLCKDKSRGIEIIGEQGTLVWHSHGKHPETADITLYSAGNKTTALYHETIWNFDQMFHDQFDALMHWYENDMQSKNTMDDAYQALQIALQIKSDSGQG